ncbi:MAG: hypothetical protein M3Q32_08155 [Pseudomonadota bacterium]|nr:hypothetical protein [Pseudomonadota bacterium]
MTTSANLRVALETFNPLERDDNQIDYFCIPRLQDAPAEASTTFHPIRVQPLTFRATLIANF